ncbi:MAG TPA: nucleotidyltransferase [Thermodesulfobacteriota bacterium]|nr:nucleotidyltransferase [Thermodesulfobacteriota bacterium]HOC38827.1 nucleotidyltransferase [Thermodesulfobacteriota bacterium]
MPIIRWLETGEEREYQINPGQMTIYQAALQALNQATVPYLVAGAFAVFAYTGIWRNTKDLDIFLKPHDLKAAFTALKRVGFSTEVRDECWLAKAYRSTFFVDLIFGVKSNSTHIDDDWFHYSHPVEVLGTNTRLIALEELIASKAYVVHRDRFDGADILHLIQAAKGKLDWQRLLLRLEDEKELLLWHLLLFDFVYPGHADYLPQGLMVSLFDEVRINWARPGNSSAFRGVLLDEQSFGADCEHLGYESVRTTMPLVDREGNRL